MALEGNTSQAREPEENFFEDELSLDMGEGSLRRRRSNWPTQSQLRVAVLKLNRDLEEVQSPGGFYHRGVAERMLRDYLRDFSALNARQLAKNPEDKRIKNVQKREGNYRVALAKMEEANGRESGGTLNWEERIVLKAMLEDYTRGVEDFLEDGGPDSLETVLEEVRASIDIMDQGMPFDLSDIRFDIMTESLSASLEGVDGLIAEILRLHSSGAIQVFNLQCGFLIESLSRTVHDRLRRYNETLELILDLEVGEYQVDARERIFKSVAFCIEALSELARQFQSVVELLNMCCKEDWWVTALELSDTRPTFRIPRWSRFSLAIRACEWSMDIVELAFHALRQLLNGVDTLRDVAFKWSCEKSRMELVIDGKPLYEQEEEEEERQGQRERARRRATVRAKLMANLRERDTRILEDKDLAAVVSKLVELKAKPRNCFSSADANMHAIADFLRQKLDGPVPEVNSLPWTFRINPSTLTHVQFVASGASGMVAKFKWLGQEVGVKTVKSPGLSQRRFEEEAAILATVQHPRVVRMIGSAFQENVGTGSLVMELMDHDLRTVIEMRCPNPGPGLSPFPVIVAMDIMLQVGEGMNFLHNHGILHHGLKAKNVLVNRARRARRTLSGAYRKSPDLASLLHSEEHYIAKLADFGTAKPRCPQQTNSLAMTAGTISWRAPEVYNVPDLEMANQYQRPADVYSFAMTCYETLTGRVPFDNVPNTEIYERIVAGHRPSLENSSLPPGLKDLIQQCWATDPNERPNFGQICKSLWQCKVDSILSVLRLHIGQ